MDLKKIMALAMLAFLALPSLTMVVGADGSTVDPEDGAGLAGAIERARLYLGNVRESAANLALEHEDNEDMQGYLDQLYALLGQYEYEGPEILFQTGGSGIADWSSDEYHSESRSAKLYVVNGTEDWAEVSIPVDIALKDISELKFWEYIESYTPKGWSVNVVLGIDADGDDDFEADLPAWHQGTTMHTLEVLHGDSFIQMDGASLNPTTGAWTETDALSISQWWTPNNTGAGFAQSATYSSTFYDSLANFVNVFLPDTTQTSLIPDADARVKCVKLVIGGSGSWMDEAAYVDDIKIDGVTYDFEEEPEALGAEAFLDQASAYLEDGEVNLAAKSLASARNILGRVRGLLTSMAKTHKVTKMQRFMEQVEHRIEGIVDKVERLRGRFGEKNANRATAAMGWARGRLGQLGRDLSVDNVDVTLVGLGDIIEDINAAIDGLGGDPSDILEAIYRLEAKIQVLNASSVRLAKKGMITSDIDAELSDVESLLNEAVVLLEGGNTEDAESLLKQAGDLVSEASKNIRRIRNQNKGSRRR